MKRIVSLFIVLLTAISGCGVIPQPVPPPQEAIIEIATLGVTLSTEQTPFPDDVGARFIAGNQFDDSYIDGGALSLHFLPKTEFAFVDSIFENPFGYEIAYSTEVDGGFRTIPGIEGGYNENNPPNSYHTRARIVDWRSDFQVESNNTVLVQTITIPAVATHVELWINTSEPMNSELVLRAPLSSLLAWRRYISPIIEENNPN